MKRIIFLYLTLLSTVMFSCEASEQYNSALDGKWTAVWETTNPHSLEAVLEGEFIFSEYNKVQITGFGYPENPFLSDTLTTELGFYLSKDSLFTIQPNETTSLSYQIVSISSDKTILKLTDDLYITLRR